jgi:hypothetical protein
MYKKEVHARVAAVVPNFKKSAVAFYTEKAGIVPDVKKASKHGENNEYSDENLVEFVVADMLSGDGLRLHVIKKILSFIQHVGKDRRQDWYIKTLAKEDPRERVFALIYNPADPEQTEVKFQEVGRDAGHMYGGDMKPLNIQNYTRSDEGHHMVTIIDVTNLLSKAVELTL